MRSVRAAALTLLLSPSLFPIARAQKVDFELAGVPVQPAKVDPAIAAVLGKVSPEAIHRTIETLVAFKTRNTLSSMETDLPANTGILPAADWIHKQFEAISTACGGCLEVKDDIFTYTPPQPDATGRMSRYGTTDEAAQRVCGDARLGSGTGEAHVPDHRTLRHAELRHDG